MRQFPRIRISIASACTLSLAVTLAACGQEADPASRRTSPDSVVAGKRADSAGVRDSTPAAIAWAPKPIVVPLPPGAHPVPMPSAASLSSDSVGPASLARAARDSSADSGHPSTQDTSVSGAGNAGPALRRAPSAAGRRRYTLTPADSARWPVRGSAPLPGALLPEHLIIAFYGNPLSKRMGILGELPPADMLSKLEVTAREWAKAEPGRKVLPALHLIVTVAQGQPGSGDKYRLRHSDRLIEQVLNWAETRGWVAFLDVQIGHSTVADELPHLMKYLERPYVHLALDPEFAMKLGGVPGKRIGTLDAEDVNFAARALAELVTRKQLPPKMLVVHRFTRRMLTNHDKIALDPRVQIVVDMDGFGSPNLKEDAYKFWIVPEPVQFAGFKLFFKNDKPMMKPAEVLDLWPQPVYIQYQ